ncbi:MAG TPA: hypothetical protein DCE23_02115 [Firmicutes bacterium]|nr:hypothetical protein [Bacillota bacterium]
MSKISIQEYQEIENNSFSLSIKEKERLFNAYQNGDNASMYTLLKSYYKNVINYVLKFCAKKSIYDIDDMIKYINSCLFQRMQICTSIYSYEKDINRLIAREALRYIKRVKINNKKDSFSFINLEIDENILKVLKDSLDPDIYYVFYQMVSGIPIEEISSKLNIDLLEARKRYIFALETLETFLANDDKRLKRRIYSIKEREGNKSSRIKVTPYSIDSIIIYFYLKDSLTHEEQRLYYYQVFSKYSYFTNELCSSLKLTEQELLALSTSLNEKISTASQSPDYLEFKEEMLNLYGPYVYNLVKSESYKKFDFSTIKEAVNLLTFDDIKKFLDDDCAYLTDNEKKLLYKYYYKVGRYSAEVEDIERDVNLNLFGYKASKEDLHPQKYYQTYLDHIDEFDESQRLFLECYYFKKKDKREFIKKYPDSKLYYRYYMLTNRLEKLYYNINNFLDNDFNRAKWLLIRSKYQERHTEERVHLLDLFYGVDSDPLSIKEIAKLYPSLTYIKVHDMISDAREAAINIYINKKHKIEITKKDYLPYLSEQYDYTDETRKILIMFLEQDLDYEEISKRTGLNRTRISNIITDGIRKIDHYRLGVLKARKISTVTLKDIYKLFGDKITEEEKEIYSLRYNYGNSNEAIAVILNIPRINVNRAMQHLYDLHDKLLIKNVTISSKDISRELHRHFTDTVLTEREQQVLSLYYGIKTKYNKTGKHLESKDIQKLLSISNYTFYHTIYESTDKIKLRKIGALSPDLSVFTREELTTILEDRHLPISDKERYIINSLFALNNHEYKSLNELSKELGDLKNSVRRRYYRAIVNIKKYLNGELDEQMDFETDIVPYLKYFSNSDRVFIYDYFKNNLSYEALGEKYHLTREMTIAIINRLRINIYEITHGKTDKKFDFDYYQEAIKSPDLPFYGDLKVATEIFDLYFGISEMRRLSIPEIKERLNLPQQTTAINNSIYQLMVSVCKLREGIKKTNEFTLEEIISYYERHKDEMDCIHKVYYERFFKRINNTQEINGKKSKIPTMITYDLLKEREANLFHLSTASKEEIKSILNNPNYILDSKTKHTLSDIVNPYGNLDGRDINHVYRIINSLIERQLLFVDKGKSYRLKLEEQ